MFARAFLYDMMSAQHDDDKALSRKVDIILALQSLLPLPAG